jgi:hypothetical protein
VVGTVRPWTGNRKVDQIRVPFTAKAGETWYFAAQAGDRAGNWTALPAGAQAVTRVAGGAATKRGVRAPSDMR